MINVYFIRVMYTKRLTRFPVKISLERKSISMAFNTFDIEIRFDLHSKKLTLMKYIKTAFHSKYKLIMSYALLHVCEKTAIINQHNT